LHEGLHEAVKAFN